MYNKILSLIVPTYNAEKYLDKGLSSFLIKDDRLLDKLEVLIVNDGSSDKSAEIAQKYVGRYPNIFRLVNKKNGGHGSGINVGANEAAGKYFKVIDADDWVLTDELAELIVKLEQVDDDVIVTPYQRFDIGTGMTEDLISKPEFFDVSYSLSEVMNQWLQCHPDLHFWGITYKTSFYQQLNYQVLEGVFYEDQEYSTIPLCYAKNIRFLNNLIYIYRIGDVNQSVFGDTQVKRHAHLEAVICRMLEQEKFVGSMPEGGERLWRKKTSMVITSYYQIMLIKNKDKENGRTITRQLNTKLKQISPAMFQLVEKKYKIFIVMSYLHITNHMYEAWIPKIIQVVRKLRGAKV